MTRRELLGVAPGAALTALKAADAPFERIDGRFHLHRSSPVIVAGQEKTAVSAAATISCRNRRRPRQRPHTITTLINIF